MFQCPGSAVPFFGRSHLGPLATHRNPGVEVVYLEAGSVLWQVEGEVVKVESHSVFFTLPWQSHGDAGMRHETGNYLYWAVLATHPPYEKPGRKLQFDARFGLPPALVRRASATLLGSRRHAFPATDRLATTMKLVVETAQHNPQRFRVQTYHYAAAMLVELLRIVENPPPPEQAPALGRVERFLEELERRCEESWTLETMAEACGLKRTRFTQSVHTLCGETPFQFLNRARLRRACELLGDPRLSITEVAFDCGFASSQYFANQFRRQYKMSPSSYRSRMGNRFDLSSGASP